MTNEEKLEMIAIKAFKQHWAKIVRSLEEGKTNYADNLIHCFEADTRTRQKILARRFYGLDHAKEMASLSEKEIKANLSCYLPRAIEYALSDPVGLFDEPKVFIKKLVIGQYVMFSLPSNEGSCLFERYDEYSDNFLEAYEDSDDFWEDSDDLEIDEYPSHQVSDDDWYEKTVGRSWHNYSILVLMKSTGETFSKTEMTWLRKSIQYNIDHAELDALWWFKCYPIANNKLWIKIYQWPNKGDYIDGFLWGEGYELSSNQFKKFVGRILEYLSKEKKWIKKLSVFNNYKSMKKEDLFDITDTFFRKYSEVLENIEIRDIEDIMNIITGRKDRDYLPELHWF